MRTYISGSRRLSNIFWALIITMGGLGFFLTGLSSYFKLNLLLFSDVSNIAFIPQGIVLTFYGTVALILGIFLWLTIWWDVGFGYNDYKRQVGVIAQEVQKVLPESVKIAPFDMDVEGNSKSGENYLTVQ